MMQQLAQQIEIAHTQAHVVRAMALHERWQRRSLRLAVVAAALAVLGVAPAAIAQEPPETKDDAPAVDAPEPATATAPRDPSAKPAPAAKKGLLDQIDDGTLPTPPKAAPTPSFLQLEWHGYFRFRPEILNNGHLGMAVPDKQIGNRAITTSAVAPPLSLWPTNNDPDKNTQSGKVGKTTEETAMAGATMRLRLQPTLSIGKDARIVSTVDVLDNAVMGGDPDYSGYQARPDVPISAFTMSTKPGVMNVKELYGELKTLVGVLRVGRQASHWGLGMLAHGGGGDGWDMGRPTLYYGGARRPADGHGYALDSGSYVDRAAFVTGIPKAQLYASVFYDYLANGLQTGDLLRPDVVPRNATGSDDVRQYGLALMRRPLSEDDAAARQHLLEVERKPAIDGGLYLVYRTQKNDLQGTTDPSKLGVNNLDSAQLMVRGATAAIADVWFRYEQRLSPLRRFVAEAEGAYIGGSVDDANALAGTADKKRDLSMWGFAGKAAFQDEGMGYYLDFGGASGDDTQCFGVYGRSDCSLATATGAPNTLITGFKFNRGYQVDNLLFHDLIGTVTNAWYIKPTVSINAFPWHSADMLGLDLSVLQAIAQNSAGTPGGKAGEITNIGTELAARGFLGRRGQAYADVIFAYAITGSAFNLVEGWYDASTSQTPTNAWKLTGHLVLPF